MCDKCPFVPFPIHENLISLVQLNKDRYTAQLWSILMDPYRRSIGYAHFAISEENIDLSILHYRILLISCIDHHRSWGVGIKNQFKLADL